MSEMTATRKGVAILALSAAWVGSAALLWRTSVPDGLDLPDLDAGNYFSARELARHERYEGFLRTLFFPAVLLQAAVLVGLILAAPRIIRRLPFRPLVQGVLLALVAVLGLWLARLPVGVTAHWWRRRYGIARQDYLEWLVDPWLELTAEAALTGAAVAVAMLLAVRLGPRWWLAGAPVVAALAAVVVIVQPLLLEPRVEPLRNARLEADVQRLADGAGVGPVDVVVRDASARTRAGNAEVYGLGPTRRVVLWDTLLDGRFSPDAIRAIVAHELAHVARDHVWKALGWVALLALPATFAIAQATRLRGGLTRPEAVPLALLAVFCLQLLLLPATNAVSRRYEAEADWVALEATRDAPAARRLTLRLVRASLGDPEPPTWAYVLRRTHPTAMQRLAMTVAWEEERRGGGAQNVSALRRRSRAGS
jgi:Zn-dependent protease with chaperone function